LFSIPVNSLLFLFLDQSDLAIYLYQFLPDLSYQAAPAPSFEFGEHVNLSN